MNSMIIYEILKEYTRVPFYRTDDFISINDDRIGRIVSFKLYVKDDEILVDFKENYKYSLSGSTRHRTNNINSFEDFKIKWTNYYNFN